MPGPADQAGVIHFCHYMHLDISQTNLKPFHTKLYCSVIALYISLRNGGKSWSPQFYEPKTRRGVHAAGMLPIGANRRDTGRD
jgi:hypothetical protein